MSSQPIQKKTSESAHHYCPPSQKTISAALSIITGIAGGALVGIAFLNLRGTGAIAAYAAGGGLLTVSGLSFLNFIILSCQKKTKPPKRPLKNRHKASPIQAAPKKPEEPTKPKKTTASKTSNHPPKELPPQPNLKHKDAQPHSNASSAQPPKIQPADPTQSDEKLNADAVGTFKAMIKAGIHQNALHSKPSGWRPLTQKVIKIDNKFVQTSFKLSSGAQAWVKKNEGSDFNKKINDLEQEALSSLQAANEIIFFQMSTEVPLHPPVAVVIAHHPKKDDPCISFVKQFVNETLATESSGGQVVLTGKDIAIKKDESNDTNKTFLRYQEFLPYLYSALDALKTEGKITDFEYKSVKEDEGQSTVTITLPVRAASHQTMSSSVNQPRDVETPAVQELETMIQKSIDERQELAEPSGWGPPNEKELILDMPPLLSSFQGTDSFKAWKKENEKGDIQDLAKLSFDSLKNKKKIIAFETKTSSPNSPTGLIVISHTPDEKHKAYVWDLVNQQISASNANTKVVLNQETIGKMKGAYRKNFNLEYISGNKFLPYLYSALELAQRDGDITKFEYNPAESESEKESITITLKPLLGSKTT